MLAEITHGERFGALENALFEALTLDQHCTACRLAEYAPQDEFAHEPLDRGTVGFVNTLSWMIGASEHVEAALPAFADLAVHCFSDRAGDGGWHSHSIDVHRCFKDIFEILAEFAHSAETRDNLLVMAAAVRPSERAR